MAQRWDRDRFERARGGGGERDYYRFEEREQLGPRGGRQELLVDERVDRRGPRSRYEERDRFLEEDRFEPPSRRAPAFLDEPVPPEVSRQALAPYRRPRPQMLRRQSSLDTFDRRPIPPRFVDEYRLPSDVPIPLPIRRPVSPPRGRYYEEFEERYHDSDDEYRDVRVSKPRRGHHRSKSRMRSRSVRRRRDSSISSESSFEEIDKTSIIGRKGRTKLPKRLAHKSAVVELGLPFMEEENFIVVQRALDKPHIDKIVETSKKYKEEKIVHKYEAGGGEEVKKEEKKVEEKKVEKVEDKGEKVEEKKEVKKEVKKEEKIEKKEEGKAVEAEIVKKTTTTTTIVDPPDHHHRHQDLILPGHRLSEEDIQREIRQLEAERRLLKYERGEWDEHSSSSHRPKDVYRVERNRKGRMALVRSAH